MRKKSQDIFLFGIYNIFERLKSKIQIKKNLTLILKSHQIILKKFLIKVYSVKDEAELQNR